MPSPFAALERLAAVSRRWWPLPLRLIVGYGFMAHGWAKLARGPGRFTEILAALHLPHPAFAAWLTIGFELAGGLAVLLGLCIPAFGVPMAVILITAIVTVHLPNGFSSIKLQSVTAAGAHFGQPGYETDLLYLAALVSLALGGPGPLALGRARPPRRPGTAGRAASGRSSAG